MKNKKQGILGRAHETYIPTVHTVEVLVPEPSYLEVEVPSKNLRRYEPLDTVQVLAELIQAGGETLCSEIHKLINSVWNKEELPQQLLLYLFIGVI
jgi:hypothetical protein